MKCEKCGLEILDGTLCENCKNVEKNITPTPSIVSTETETMNATEQIPEQYDPVANLMNETVNQTVNIEKSELENSIPLGDNNEIPSTPVNENVVNIAPEPILNAQTESSIVQPATETPAVQSQIGNTNSQDQVQPQTAKVVEKKKKKTSTIIIIAVVVVLGLFFIFFVLPLISATKSTLGMYDQAKTNTFVTKVQHTIDK